jgi:hypothetical protein
MRVSDANKPYPHPPPLAAMGAVARLPAISLAAALNLLLCGCVPVASNYYDIEGPGDKQIFAGCAMKVEAELKTRLTDGVGVIYWGSAKHESAGRAISISFTIAGSQVVRLTEPVVEITSNGSMPPLNIGIARVRRAYVESSPSCDPPRGSAYQRPDEPMQRVQGLFQGRPVTDSVFVIDLTVPGNPKEFSVQLPAVKVDDRLIEVPPVRFVHKTSVHAVGAFTGQPIS